MNTLIPILLAMGMIGFIIFQTFTIQTTAQDDTSLLLSVKELEQSLVVASQSLNNYTYLDSEANKNEALAILQETKVNLDALASLTKIPEHQKLIDKIAGKFTELEKATKAGLQENNRPEIKKQSLRIKGILNDMYLLKKRNERMVSRDDTSNKTKNWFHYNNNHHRQYLINPSNDCLFLYGC